MASRLPRPLAHLSPRRRLLVLGTALVAAVALVWALVAVVGRAQTSPAPPPDQPGPVVLVPGFGGNRDTSPLERLAERVRATGRTATVLRLPGDGMGDLGEQAAALDAAVKEALGDGAPSVDVVGYSAGGVVARLWAHDHDGAHKARRVITLGSPHHGAQLAAAGHAVIAGGCPPACQQLIPGSSLLTRLNRTALPDPPAWLSIWTTQDQVVQPPESAKLDGAVNVPLQAVCPDQRVRHAQLPTDPLTVAIVLRALGTEPLRTPAQAECPALRGTS